MVKIRITKIFNFEMAHALWNYNGACRNIHGHSYNLFVTVIGEIVNDKNNPKCGMAIDFADLKKIVNEHIVNKFDHALVISSEAPYENLLKTEQMFDKVEIFAHQPTCENLVIEIAERIKKHLPDNIKLYSIKLAETATSYAEWYAEDNE